MCYCSRAMKALQRLKAPQIKALLKWYEKSHRDFPWRDNPDPYWVWLAEIMSQQTTMTALLPYFYRFIEKFPTVEALAKADEQSVLSAWAGLGYYSRARNVHRSAKIIVGERGGRFPESFEKWLELPGIGPYTAAAVASQCFGVKEPVWDGNVLRVCSRLERRSDVFEKTFRVEMEDALRQKMSNFSASEFNQAFMELGATICTPKNPECGRCPLSEICFSLKSSVVAKFPPPKPRIKNIEIKCRVFVKLFASKNGQYFAFVKKREGQVWFPGLWDFPSELGGLSKPIASIQELSTTAVEFGEVRHQITHHKIHLKGLAEVVDKNNVEKKNSASSEAERWLSLEELTSDEPPVPLSSTAKKIVRLLLKSKTQQLALF